MKRNSVIKLYVKAIWLIFKQKGHIYKKLPMNEEKKKLVVLANGPSLNVSLKNMKVNQEYDYMCVNLFPAKNELFEIIRPRFLCMIDPIFYDKDSPKREDVILLEKKLDKVDWDMYVICYWKQRIETNNEHIHYLFINYNYYLGRVNRSAFWLFEHNFACIEYKNVAVACIFAGIQMHYPVIEVYGIDSNAYLNVSVNNRNEMIVKETHFYGEKIYNYSDLYPSVRNGGMEYLFRNQMELMQAFGLLNEYAKHNAIKVLNKTPNSYVDVFERE